MTLYTSKVVAQWLGLSERRVRQLRDEGVLTEARPGLYDLQQSVLRYIQYLGGAGREGLNEERRKLTAAKREAAEMENQIRRGSLHATEDFEVGLKTVLLNMRSRLLVIPAALSPALSEMGGDRTAIFDKLKDAIDEALEELSQYSVTMAVTEDKGDGLPHQ